MPHRVNHLVGGRYRIHTPLGSGGMGSVYQATDETLGREVAVKVFREVPSSEVEWMRQEREIQLLATLNHPGLISLHDAGVHVFGDETRLYLVMELMSDPTLDVRMAEGPMPAHDVASIGAQVAEALAYIHSRGVVHRDVKPANILISDVAGMAFHRVAKLTDFGIASFTGGQNYTAEGVLLGTASYMSPEQVSRGPITAATDIYSLGLVLLEALTGERPFPGTAVESLAGRINGDPAIPDNLAPQWRDLIRRMTDHDPEKRPKAATISRVLRGASEMMSGEDRTGATAARPESAAAPVAVGSRRRSLSGVEVGVLVIAVGIISWIAGVNAGTMIASSPPSSAETRPAAVDLTGEESTDLDGFRDSLDVIVDQGGDVDAKLDRLDQLETSAQSAEVRGSITQAELGRFQAELDEARDTLGG
jgi:tRNA A-37 threonylcarbamoyl transferase component Bud32